MRKWGSGSGRRLPWPSTASPPPAPLSLSLAASPRFSAFLVRLFDGKRKAREKGWDRRDGSRDGNGDGRRIGEGARGDADGVPCRWLLRPLHPPPAFYASLASLAIPQLSWRV